MGSSVVVVVMVTPQGCPKQDRADIALQNIKRGAVGVGGCQKHLRWGGEGTGRQRKSQRETKAESKEGREGEGREGQPQGQR